MKRESEKKDDEKRDDPESERRWRGGLKEEKKEEGLLKRTDCRLPQDYGSMVGTSRLQRALNRTGELEKRSMKKRAAMFLPHVNVIQTTIYDIYVQVCFWEVFQLYIYLSLIAIMTQVSWLYLWSHSSCQPISFLELVLEICTFDIFVHVFVHGVLCFFTWDVLETCYLRCTWDVLETSVSLLEMYLWDLLFQVYLRCTWDLLFDMYLSCTWDFQMHQLEIHVWRTCSLIFFNRFFSKMLMKMWCRFDADFQICI